MKAVILAGGSGSRLWPFTRRHRPKQFCELGSDKPMVLQTYERLLGMFDDEDIWFSTVPQFASRLQEIFPRSKERTIIEPAQRDTGPAMGFCAWRLARERPDEAVVFVPADHSIRNPQRFLTCLAEGERIVVTTGHMADIGIEPTFPSTVLGYTRVGDLVSNQEAEVYEFRGHTEKPDHATASQYLRQGDYLWHGNYYMWTPAKFQAAYRRYSPVMASALDDCMACLEARDQEGLRMAYESMPKIAIDYAITEKMDPSDVRVIKGNFGWSDIGAWDTLYDKMSREQDEAGNLLQGKAHVVSIDSRNCLVSGPSKKVIATIGTSGLVIVDTEDALLVCDKARAQDVKKVVSVLLEQDKQAHI